MDFKELEYFSTIVKCGNLTHAARQLYVSQPTLSKFLQKLEEDLGLVLFQRGSRRLKLTYAGQRYYAHVERILSQKREMDAEMTDILRSDRGVLYVGIPPFRCSFSLPKVLPIHSSLSEDCEKNRDRLVNGGLVHKFTEITTDFDPPKLTPKTLVIDGLFGSGLNKPLTGGFASLVKYINQSPSFVVSIDMPSGLLTENNSFDQAF